MMKVLVRLMCAASAVLMAGGVASGARVPQWRDWSGEVQLSGGSPFENDLGLDEVLRLDRRTTPILEHIGESVLAVQLLHSTRPVSSTAAFGLATPRAIASPAQDNDRQRGQDIARLMRELNLPSVSGNKGKTSMASLALGREDNDQKQSAWGWLADELRDNPEAANVLADSETLDPKLNSLLDQLASQDSPASFRPTDAGDTTDTASRGKSALNNLATADASLEFMPAGNLDGGIAAFANAPLSSDRTRDLLANLAGSRKSADTRGSSADSSSETADATPVNPQNLAPNWDDLMAGGKTISWQEATGFVNASDLASTSGKKNSSASTWDLSADHAGTDGGNWQLSDLSGAADRTDFFALSSPSDASDSFSSFGHDTSRASDGSGWSPAPASFGGNGYGSFQTPPNSTPPNIWSIGGLGTGPSPGATPFGTGTTPSYGVNWNAANSTPRLQSPFDAGSSGSMLRDTLKPPTGGGAKPAWY